MVVLVCPGLDEARLELGKTVEARMMVTIVAKCKISYFGRAGSDSGEGERLIVLKGDGCVLVHRSRDYQAVKWQPSGCVFQMRIESGRLLVKAVRPSPLETLTIEMDRIEFLSTLNLKDEAEFILHSSEEEMQKAILAEPDLIEQGLRVIDFEKKVAPGFVDVYGIDSRGNTVVIERKKHPAGAAAVKQLVEYLKYLSPAEGKKLRPIIVAPSLAKGVLPTVEKMKIEFKPLTLQKSLETLQKRLKSDQKALKGWLGDAPSEKS